MKSRPLNSHELLIQILHQLIRIQDIQRTDAQLDTNSFIKIMNIWICRQYLFV